MKKIQNVNKNVAEKGTQVVPQLAEEFESCRKILLALVDETCQHFLFVP